MEESKVPHCLGFIMDGNRRFAKEAGLPTLEGHAQGAETFFEVVRFVRDKGISHAVFYAFSTENWQRTETEVAYLLELFGALLGRMEEELTEEGVRVRVIGRREDFPTELQTRIQELEEKSRQYEGTTIWVALSYGGRSEIVSAVNEAIKRGEVVDETSFKSLLWSAELPDPDMIIRTSGEARLSNFLTWAAAYSELYFIEKHWPALTKADLEDILIEYGRRSRRYGS